MTDMFRLPEFVHDRPDAGRGSRSLGLYRVLQHKSVGRRVPPGIYFQGYDVPLDLNPDPPPMPTQEASHLLSLSRMAAAVSAAGGNSRAARRPNGMRTLAALVDGRLVASASVRQGGARQAAVSDFILRRIVGEVGCVLDDAARARGVRLLLTVNSDLPARLQGYSTVIRQVLFEMGSLVIRSARSGSGAVTIRVSEEPSPADEIRLRFTVKPGDGPASGHPDHPQGWVDEAGEMLDTCRQLLGPVHGEFGAREQFDEGPLFWFTIPCREVREDNPEAARGDAAA